MSYQLNTLNPAQFLTLIEAIREGGGGGGGGNITHSATVKGITITATKTPDGRVTVDMYGTLTEELATSGARIDFYTLPDDFKAIRNRPVYLIINYSTYGEIYTNTSGVIRLGVTRNMADAANKNLTGGMYLSYDYMTA